MNPKISLIAAVAENGVIGKKGAGLLWHIPEDMRHFKEATTGHAVIMGRKTWGTLGKPLPNRVNIVITRDSDYKAEGATVTHSLAEALGVAGKHEKGEVFIMGGGEIYEQAVGLADKLYLTLVHQNFEGDVFFPDYSDFSKEIFREEGESNGLKFTFLELEKPR
ncbi:MAG: dihydrofolate reductase [Candidatus Colwellbacteria bacterium]